MSKPDWHCPQRHRLKALQACLLRFELPPNLDFPAPDFPQKKFYRRPVIPIFFRKNPFGENVEGLSHCGNESYDLTRLFNQQDSKVRFSSGIDGTDFFFRQYVIQILPPVLQGD